MTSQTRVHIVSLGCARNDVDSEELAGRLEAGGFVLVDEPTEAEAVRRAGYLPKGRYTIREWERDGDVLMFHPQTNREYEFTNE